MYDFRPTGLALSRESQENFVPGDYGIYNEGKKVHFVYKSKRYKRLQKSRIPDCITPSSSPESFLMQSMVTFDNYSAALTKKVCFFLFGTFHYV